MNSQDRLHYEDLEEGTIIQLGQHTITKDEIISFAKEFDPLPFHLDEEVAKKSLLGGLASSGWQTAGITLRMLVDAFLGNVASKGGLGFENLKWKKPLMKGDTLTGTVTLSSLRLSKSHPEKAVMIFEFDMRNQKNQQVMTMSLANLVAVRHPKKTEGASA
ncbi:MaoC family dehydratase [Maritalea mediterranea]|uniref:MaoC family dehydratase n=1 Tax=Maritalea mediterranea TaxID=2909667 RepID=A0ABS9E857_9HYPH|nr:MaoC family dehydratase [Maritalea mediterranea]MCF4099068.1 MaoC family dehydratase [Maritalea mediterranea]